MSLNNQDNLSLKRETFRCEIRRTALKNDLKKQRGMMQHAILQNLSKDLDQQKCFDVTIFRSLLQMTENDQQIHYAVLSNYMVDFLQDTAFDVFEAFKERRSQKVSFGRAVRLSLEAQWCIRSEMLYNIHSFVGSQNAEVVKHGLSCVLYLFKCQEYDTILSLENFKKIIHEHLFSDNLQVSNLAKYILLKLLHQDQTVERVVAKGVEKQLLFLLRSNKSRQAVLEVLQSMFKIIDLQLGHQELLKQLLILHYTGSENTEGVLSCQIWLNFAKSQPISKIVMAINLGLQKTLGDKLSHQSTKIQYITLCTIDTIYQRLSGENEPDILHQVIYNFEETFRLSSTLQQMQSRDNCQVSRMARGILDGYYTYNTDDYVE